MENEPKKSKISLSKPSDIPDYETQTQPIELPSNVQPMYSESQYQQQPYQQSQQNYSQPQTIYKQDEARHLNANIPKTYQQNNSPIPMNNNSPFQNSNYARNINNINTATKFCKFCGSKIPFDAVVCTQCGRQVEQLQQGNNNYQHYQQNNTYINNVNINNANISDKTKTNALLLCALGFFGLGGIHRLYTGKTLSGIIYLLTGGLFYIGTIIDLISIISGNFKDGHGRFLK